MFSWLKKEIIRVFPAFLFFFISFNLINITEGFIFQEAGIGRFSFLTILIASALVAKVLVVIDNLPFINVFPNKPLVYNIIWKTMLYGVVTGIVRLLIRLVPFLSKDDSIESFFQDTNWSLFFAILSWYFILYFVFVTFRDFAETVGFAKVRRIFFGK
jgi:hypothetical protein